MRKLRDALKLEIHVDGVWRPVGEVTLDGDAALGTAAATSFEYDLDYAVASLHAHDERAVSVHFPVDLARHTLSMWPTFLLDLLPQGAAAKLIERKYGLRDFPSHYWQILSTTLIAPPGNLRVRPPADFIAGGGGRKGHPGFTRSEVAEKGPDFVDHMVASGAPIGGTIGAGGAAPKFLLREDHQDPARRPTKLRGLRRSTGLCTYCEKEALT